MGTLDTQNRVQFAMTRLPTELQAAVLEQADFRDLKALSLVSKGLRALALSRLFETVTLVVYEEELRHEGVSDQQLRRELQADLVPGFFPTRVRHLRYERPDVYLGGCQCANFRSWRAMNVLDAMKDNQLKALSFDLGTRLPEAFLSPPTSARGTATPCEPGYVAIGSSAEAEMPISYLVNSQTALESLSLVTDSYCVRVRSRAARGERTIPLAQFNKLRSFSWRNLYRSEEVRAVHELLRARAAYIEELELDFASWRDVVKYTDVIPDKTSSAITLANTILPKKIKGEFIRLSRLKKLSLSDTTFPEDPSDIATALNMNYLQHLTICICINTSALLWSAVKGGMKLSLISLELVMKDLVKKDWIISPVAALLRSFQGLQSLYLLIQTIWSTMDYWSAIANHKSTLKTLVYHQRVPDTRSRDPSPPTPASRSCHGSVTENVRASFATLNLVCLGIYNVPEGLKASLQSSSSKDTVKMLHIRHSNPGRGLNSGYWAERWFDTKTDGSADPDDKDSTGYGNCDFHALYDFIQWAFGPQGLPRLQVLAFGDFSVEGCNNDDMMIFGRRSTPDTCYPFERIDWPMEPESQSFDHFDGISRPFEFLEACPSHPFVGLNEDGDWPESLF